MLDYAYDAGRYSALRWLQGKGREDNPYSADDAWRWSQGWQREIADYQEWCREICRSN